MNIIRKSNQKYLQFLGQNTRDENQSVRLMKYLVIEDVDNGKAIHNELTRSFIWIPNEQWNKIYDDLNVDYVQWLWNNYFLVNENYDEHAAQEKLKLNGRPSCENETYLKSGRIYEFTIFSTMACNARCSYCYEAGRPQKPMTAETARKVGDWIVKNAMKNGREIQLRWFGGEPLVGEHCIDIICQIVKDAGFNYSSSMTTNGFLFKKEKLDKYRDLWHLRSGQITLDGTEEEYNKIKNYKNVKGKSPYKIVMDNIQMMADWGMNISIRMNTCVENAENLKKLIKELYTRFGNHKNIAPYCWPIFEDDDNPRTAEENELLYTKLREIDEVLDHYGYLHGRDRGTYVRATHCMIDHGQAVVIGTQGDIGVCEHYSEDHFWGHVDNPEMKDMTEIRKFQDYVEDYDICNDCPIKPSCIRAKMCHDLRNCNIWIKEWEMRKAHRGVLDMYRRWRNNVNRNRQNRINQQNQNNQQQKCNCKQNTCQCNDKVEKIEKEETSGFFNNILIWLGLK